MEDNNLKDALGRAASATVEHLVSTVAKYAVIISAILVAGFRPYLLFHELGHHAMSSYMAIAHILVGGIFGACIQSGRSWKDWLFYTASGMTIVEVVCVLFKLLS